MGDKKSRIGNTSRERDRELLIPVADSVDDDFSSKPSSSASSSHHHSGREPIFCDSIMEGKWTMFVQGCSGLDEIHFVPISWNSWTSRIQIIFCISLVTQQEPLCKCPICFLLVLKITKQEELRLPPTLLFHATQNLQKARNWCSSEVMLYFLAS